jgi:hypothetical protein
MPPTLLLLKFVSSIFFSEPFEKGYCTFSEFDDECDIDMALALDMVQKRNANKLKRFWELTKRQSRSE